MLHVIDALYDARDLLIAPAACNLCDTEAKQALSCERDELHPMSRCATVRAKNKLWVNVSALVATAVSKGKFRSFCGVIWCNCPCRGRMSP